MELVGIRCASEILFVGIIGINIVAVCVAQVSVIGETCGAQLSLIDPVPDD